MTLNLNSDDGNAVSSSVFYLKFFEHPSFGQVAHEIYPSEWKVHSSEISITIMYCWYMFLMAVATDFTHVTINLVCCCLSPVLISHKRSCWKISQSLKPISVFPLTHNRCEVVISWWSPLLPKISIYATKCESILEKSGIFIHLQSKYCINLSCKKNLTISWVQIAARW